MVPIVKAAASIKRMSVRFGITTLDSWKLTRLWGHAQARVGNVDNVRCRSDVETHRASSIRQLTGLRLLGPLAG